MGFFIGLIVGIFLSKDDGTGKKIEPINFQNLQSGQQNYQGFYNQMTAQQKQFEVKET